LIPHPAYVCQRLHWIMAESVSPQTRILFHL